MVNGLNEVLVNGDIPNGEGGMLVSDQEYKWIEERMNRLISWLESSGFKVVVGDDGKYEAL